MGGRVRQLRWARGLRQRDLAARLQIIGWDAGRVTVSKIESRLRWVADDELLQLAKALGVNVADLFPKESPFTEAPGKLPESRQGARLERWQSRSAPPEQAGR